MESNLASKHDSKSAVVAYQWPCRMPASQTIVPVINTKLTKELPEEWYDRKM